MARGDRQIGSYAGLLVALRQSSMELLALADHFDPEAANRTLSIGEGSLTFAELLRTHVTPHIRRHTQDISVLVGAASNGSVSARREWCELSGGMSR